jgi:hypothetical protein
MVDFDIAAAREKARALAHGGRFREAVAIGKTVHRECPDVGFAAELRDWRHRAYYEVPPGAAPNPWPRDYANPFPDIVNRIPEIDAADLTLDILGGAMTHQPALIVRGLFSQERMDLLRGAITKPFGEEGRNSGHYNEIEPLHGSAFQLVVSRTLFPGVETNMADAPDVLETWFAGLEECGALDMVSAYLGEHPAISACKANIYTMPPLTEPVAWHQDGVAFGDATRAVNIWVAASECGEDSPGLEFVPVRLTEIVDTGTLGSEHHWSISNQVAESVTEVDSAKPLFAPGDAVFFEKYSLHRASSLPTMNTVRFALQSWLVAPSMYCAREAGDESPMLWI